MCGIAGWASLDPRRPPPMGAEGVLRSMCSRLVHRGPDAEGYMHAEGVALGMRRLSVIDLKTGDQPVFNEDKSISVVLNGEIYNYRELRRALELDGHKFRGSSDTEVLPHLYEKYGDGLLEYLDGMFAFALWDSRRRRLVIARDRFGEKPLYWGMFSGALWFASEPKALLASDAVPPSLDLQALREFLSFDYVPSPRSIFAGIRKLPAAHVLTLEDGRAEERRYWRLSFAKPHRQPSEREAAAEVRRRLAESVRARLVSDVPLGVLLSGGIDSSAIAALAAEASATRVQTFSIAFEEASFDESRHARAVAAHIGTEHHEERLSAEAAAPLVADIGGWMDEPFSDPSLVPTYLLARFARRSVTVALGGDGGDELFAGYPTYAGDRFATSYEKIPRALHRALIEPLVRRLPVGTGNWSFDARARRFAAAVYHDAVARHHMWFGSFTESQQHDLLTAAVRERTDADVYRAARALDADSSARDLVERMQDLDLQLYMADDILTKVDRASMAVSLEVRAPFLDAHLAEYAASLPPRFKLHGRTSKYILKQAVAPLLPASILRRPKKGFGMPVADWLKGALRLLARDLLAPERVRRAGLFDARYVERLQHEHESGQANHGKLLWTLLMFELWRSRFLPAN